MPVNLAPHTRLLTRHWLLALWKFSRPHTVIGTSLSVLGLGVMALPSLPFFPLGPGGLDPSAVAVPEGFYGYFLQLVLVTLVPSLCANIYIVGLNQLVDIDIDRINKPALPLAAGDFSPAQGRGIVVTTGLLALGLAWMQGYFLFLTVLLSMAIGTAYSLPPIRLKRFPFWAALCIFGVRGGVVNLGFYQHFRQRLGGAEGIPAQVWMLTGFVIFFALAIALCKDIPDQIGDRQFQIRTLTVRMGHRFVFNLTCWILAACYGGVIIVALLGLPSRQNAVLSATHGSLLLLLWFRKQRVNLASHSQITKFYQWIWKLFFLEYVLFPFVCLWP
ncbi:MAG: homogentisate phytyltransferase [Acaryochloridaceae cyanobacterium SU_2_1]|nr:homogentisate phytyltransferase [Acaryochloridaceae cyanobacterium SU_2_1]